MSGATSPEHYNKRNQGYRRGDMHYQYMHTRNGESDAFVGYILKRAPHAPASQVVRVSQH
jgi:hypothetical protein